MPHASTVLVPSFAILLILALVYIGVIGTLNFVLLRKHTTRFESGFPTQNPADRKARLRNRAPRRARVVSIRDGQPDLADEETDWDSFHDRTIA